MESSSRDMPAGSPPRGYACVVDSVADMAVLVNFQPVTLTLVQIHPLLPKVSVASVSHLEYHGPSKLCQVSAECRVFAAQSL
jgi:hypothetical protein